jgi:hypothetical protein
VVLEVGAARAHDVPEEVYFPSRDGKTQLVGFLFKSDKQGPFPAVVMMHGRSGAYSSLYHGTYTAQTLNQRHKMWGEFWADRGYLALQMTLGADTVEKLRRAQDLLRHAIPDGDPAAILDRALTLLLAQVTRTKLAATKRPRITLPESHRRSRYVPASVRRAVWARDEGRCTFTGPEGRCGETAFIELHHLEPYALGGATTVEGIALRCRAHNVYEADREFRVLENAVSLDRLL